MLCGIEQAAQRKEILERGEAEVMAVGITIGKIAGVPISLDYSWFVIFFLLVWSIGFSSMPDTYPGLTAPEYLITGFVSAVLFFASILAHELLHSVVATRHGLRIRRITLYLLGGVSEMEEEPRDPSVELKMAAAGPLASVAIAGAAAALWFLARSARISPLVQAPLMYLAVVNGSVAAFNLIPAFPMDGGRIFRSLLWRRNGDIVRSTELASKVGRGFAYALTIFGLYWMFFIDLVSGIWFVLIGWFISSSAQSALSQIRVEEDLRGVRAGDIMTRNVDFVTGGMSLSELQEEFLRTKHTGFPVLANGELEGCVTFSDLKRVSRETWPSRTVGEIMTPAEKLVTVSEREPATSVIPKMRGNSIGRVFVTDEAGRITGIITRSDVVKVLEMKGGMLGVGRGFVTRSGQFEMTAEVGMNIVLDQLREKGFGWRAEYQQGTFDLLARADVTISSGEMAARFTFKAVTPGTHMIRLLEEPESGVGEVGQKHKAIRTVVYRVLVK